MQPLVSQHLERRVLAIGFLLVGLVALVVAVSTARSVAGALVTFLLTAALYGGWMRLFMRRYLRRAAEAARPAPAGAAREPISGTIRRAGVGLGAYAAVLGLFAGVAGPGEAPAALAMLAGIAAGGGLWMLLDARWIDRWERDHGRRLLRETRLRWVDGALNAPASAFSEPLGATARGGSG